MIQRYLISITVDDAMSPEALIEIDFWLRPRIKLYVIE
jgi:hypothetical protein